MTKPTAFFLLIICICSCSGIGNKKEIKWNYPLDNPFPEILQTREYDSDRIGIIAKLSPESVQFSCRLRNDSPYYWCDIEGTLTKPKLGFPSKITSTFHVVVDINGRNNAKNFISRLKSNKKFIHVVLVHNPSISEIDNSIYAPLLGIYNIKECIDLFHNYSLCPKAAKKLDIFSGKYIE